MKTLTYFSEIYSVKNFIYLFTEKHNEVFLDVT